MTIQAAIESAIRGGYMTRGFPMEEMIMHDFVCDAVLDPSFWQSLGKAMSWGKCIHHGNNECDCDRAVRKPEWIDKWHRLIDHLASGGTIESYFETLWTKN